MPSTRRCRDDRQNICTKLNTDALRNALGDFDYAVGDLQEILRAAWRLLTPAQRRALFAEPELEELAELTEYEPVIGHLTRSDGDGAGEGGPVAADRD
jgi:hypothetical protein